MIRWEKIIKIPNKNADKKTNPRVCLLIFLFATVVFIFLLRFFTSFFILGCCFLSFFSIRMCFVMLLFSFSCSASVLCFQKRKIQWKTLVLFYGKDGISCVAFLVNAFALQKNLYHPFLSKLLHSHMYSSLHHQNSMRREKTKAK